MVSSDFGKLEVSRHLSSGMPCARAGLATAVAAAASPAALRNCRSFIGISSLETCLATAPLVSRFRRSYPFAARTRTNVGTKGILEPVWYYGFGFVCQTEEQR